MIRTILSPIDGSKDSFTSYKYALLLASKFNAAIHVVFIVDQRKTQMPFIYSGAAYDMAYERVYIPPDQEMRRLYGRLKSDLKEFADRCIKTCEELSKEMDVEFSFNISDGFPAAIIEEMSHAADLVVIGQHGENAGSKKQTAGSTTEEIVRSSPRPVIVCPEKFNNPVKILLPYDGSRASENTLQYYTANFAAFVPEVIFLCAESDPSEDSIYQNEVSYLQQHNSSVKVLRKTGNPIQSIQSIVEEETPDLIMIGSHGRHKLFDYLLGSTTIHVVRKSRVPVLIVY